MCIGKTIKTPIPNNTNHALKTHPPVKTRVIASLLEEIYIKFHHRHFVQPDPLQFLYNYSHIKDREIVGLIASSLALGRVKSIIEAIKKVLDKLPSPYMDLTSLTEIDLISLFEDFKYRFYNHFDLINLLLAIKRIIIQYGSLNECFIAGYSEEDETILPALSYFIRELSKENPLKMLANPEKGSSCKRLQLYLRWMVRDDDIDPGGWTGISKSKLIIPLDTHIFKVSKLINLTNRNDTGMKTALEITDNLRKYDTEDPVKFDFSLTRPGIHPNLDYKEFKLR